MHDLSGLTFEEVRVVFPVRAEEVKFFGLGLGGQDGDGVADVVDGDGVGGRHLSWKSHLRVGHGAQARTDLLQVQEVTRSLLSSLLQTQHDLVQDEEQKGRE